MLGLFRPAVLLLRNESHVAQCDRVWLFADVEPLLVPVIKRCVPRAVQVLGLHPVAKVEVHTSGYLRATASFLPQTEKMAKEVKMGLEAAMRFAKMNEGGDKKNRVGILIANPNLVIQTEPLKERVHWNPKTPLEEIFKNHNLT